MALVVVGFGAAAACARMGAPPGGPEDRIPPQVIATTPDTFAVLDGPYQEAVRFRFNERISERPARGDLSDAVVVSPRTGQVEVEHSRESLEVSVIGGFREGVVYRITVQPVVRDMFQNSMLDAFELVFSTGPVIEPYVLAGTVIDRINGESVEGARVNAVLRDPGPDTLIHTAVTDTGGVFAMRYVPQGVYRLTAFEDRNRNVELDGFEPRGTSPAILDPPADTSIVEVAVLAPDTTPARVVSAEVVDSAAVRIETDDYLDPGSRYLDSVRVELVPGREGEETEEEGAAEEVAGGETPEGEGEELGPEATDPGEQDTPVLSVDSLFHAHEWERRAATIDSLEQARADSVDRARADSLSAVAESLAAAGDSAAADSVRAMARQADPGSGGGPGRETTDAAYETPRAEQEFYALLDRTMPFNEPYRLTVEGIENINDVRGGGGEASVVRIPPPDTTAADTTGTAADSAAVADTAAAVDTSAVPEPDTSSAGDPVAVADTLSAPDTAAPDNAGAGVPRLRRRTGAGSADPIPAPPRPAPFRRAGPKRSLRSRRTEVSGA